jgi:hypothetical protein
MVLIEADQPIGDSLSGSSVGTGGGPKYGVAVTTGTLVYHDTTQPLARRPSGHDPCVIQRTVEEGTINDLSASHPWFWSDGAKVGIELLQR